MSLNIKIVQDAKDMASCFALRDEVFIKEQDVPPAEEVDGEDDQCIHVLATVGDTPIGTARFQPKNGAIKIQRVCIRKVDRGKNYGAGLIRFIADHVKHNRSETRLILGSQTHACAFYEKLGFTAFGDEYMDAGIPHYDMECVLSA